MVLQLDNSLLVRSSCCHQIQLGYNLLLVYQGGIFRGNSSKAKRGKGTLGREEELATLTVDWPVGHGMASSLLQDSHSVSLHILYNALLY